MFYIWEIVLFVQQGLYLEQVSLEEKKQIDGVPQV